MMGDRIRYKLFRRVRQAINTGGYELRLPPDWWNLFFTQTPREYRFISTKVNEPHFLCAGIPVIFDPALRPSAKGASNA